MESSQTTAYHLRQRTGDTPGKLWPLSQHGLLIGRGSGCIIRIDSPWVSRVHCEVLSENGKPRVLNRSKHSVTLVNGIACNDSFLRPGDVLEVPGTEFDIVLLEDAPLAPGDQERHTPTTQGFHESPFLAARSHSAPDYENEISNMRALFNLTRKLARVESLDVLVSMLASHLQHAMHPDRLWIALRVRPDGDVALYPPSSPHEEEDAPVGLIRDACRIRQGMLSSKGAQPSVMIAPLIATDTAFGALALQRAPQNTPFSDADLGYLLAVADPVAPLIRAVERLEQFERDENSGFIPRVTSQHLIGASDSFVRLKNKLVRAASSHAHVLLLGETGVGKELAARLVHEASPRANGPYVVVNCAAIPGEIFESEMFGHEKGAFTGAHAARKGLIEQAHGGTLFLDEVGDLSRVNQARLLRAIESGNFRRLGADSEIHVDLRVISATNQPLDESAEFRRDLYHRLSGVVIQIPPLRDRRDDIPELAYHFLRECALHGRGHPSSFSQTAMKRLVGYNWPGNIRELRNVVERALLTTNGAIIDAVDVPEIRTGSTRTTVSAANFVDLERQHLEKALEMNDGKVKPTAKALGIPKSTLYYKLNKHGLKSRR